MELPETPSWRTANGCDECKGTGYSGRVAVVEIVQLNDDLREAIVTRASEQKLASIARNQGYLTLFEDGICKAAAGLTTLAEVRRVCGADAV